MNKEENRPLPEAEPSRYVKLTAEAISSIPNLTPKVVADISILTPIKLFKLGWPNKFMIVEVYDDPKRGQLLKLDPCCDWMVDHEKEEPLCRAHPAKYFELYPPEQDKKYFGLNLSGQELVSVEYMEKDNPNLVLKFAGQRPIAVSGKAAKAVAKFIHEKGLF